MAESAKFVHHVDGLAINFNISLQTQKIISRLKLLRLTSSYVKRHITRARYFETDHGFHKRKGQATYQKLIADLDTDNPHGTYCYHCRNMAMIDDMVISHARCSLARVYHEECGRLINVWP